MTAMRIDAWHLPDLRPGDIASWGELSYGDEPVVLRYPLLLGSALRRHARALREARARSLASRRAGDIIEIIDHAVTRLQDDRGEVPERLRWLMAAITGYSQPMLKLGLRRAMHDWRAPALDALLQAELGDPAVLEDFVEHVPGIRTRAVAPELIVHVFAGNVPGVSVTSLVRALLVRSASLGKTASGEPLLAVLFAKAVAAADPAVGDCLAVTYWPGGSELDGVAFGAADAVVAYGGRESIEQIRLRVPVGIPLIDHGPRISFAMIAADALASEEDARRLARAAARATAVFDQQGCVSPHLIYVEDPAGASAHTWAARLAEALAETANELPRGVTGAAEAAAIHDARATAEFRAIAGESIAVYASPDTGWTVIFDPKPDFEASCLNRLIRVKPVPRLEDALPLIMPYRDVLQTVALEAPAPRRDALARRLAEAGITRITTLEAMPWPPPPWHHDGRGPLRELLRWADLEG
jgi:hypothetical protein